MELKKWLYLLRDKASGNYIYLDSNNNVSYTATPTAIVYTPDGWQAKSIAWERDLTKFGLVRSFTVNLNYVKDGKVLLEKIALQQSFETPIEQVIQKLNFNTGSNAYEYIDFYVGEVSLSELESDELRVTVPLSEGGISRQLKANENTVYEFDLDEVTIYDDGCYLYDKANFAATPISIPTNTPTHFVPASMINREGQAAGFAGFTVNGDGYEDVTTSDKFLFLTSQDIPFLRIKGTINIQFNLNGAPTPTSRYVVVLNSNLRPGVVFNSAGVAYLTPNGNAGYHLANINNTVSFDFDVTFTASANEKFFIYAYSNTGVSGPSINSMTYLDSDFYIQFKSRYRSSYIAGVTAWELFQRLTEKITGDRANAQSTLLQSLDNIVLSCGDAVRGITGAKIKTSMADFFKFCRVVMCAGMAVENEKLVIEALDHFCDVSSAVSLGECRNFKWKFAQDLLFNAVKIGYDAKSASNTDNVNGKYSFNNSFLFSTSIVSVSKTLELICPYISDPLYQETIRINLDGKNTTDNNADNEIMIFNTEPQAAGSYTANFGSFFSNYFILLQGAASELNNYPAGLVITITDSTGSNSGTYTVLGSFVQNTTDLAIIIGTAVVTETNKPITIDTNSLKLLRVSYVNSDTGVLDIASLYNIEYLTPKRILNRWMPYINSCLFQFYGTDLAFNSTEKNRELKTDDGVEVIDEDADEILGNTQLLFKAIDYNFETPVGDVVPTTLNSDPNTGFTTTNPLNGRNFTGILIKGAMAANELTPQSFRLLAGPDEDENNLL